MNTASIGQLFKTRKNPLAFKLVATSAWLSFAAFAAYHGTLGDTVAWWASAFFCVVAYGMASGRILFPTAYQGSKKYVFFISYSFTTGVIMWLLIQKLIT